MKLYLFLCFTFSFILYSHSQQSGESLFKAVEKNKLNDVKKIVGKDSSLIDYVKIYGDFEFLPVIVKAAMDDRTEIALYLIEKGANVNVVDGFLMTSLMWAANNGNTMLVKALLEKGADKEMVSVQGFTALSAAKDKGHEEIVRLLSTE